MRPEHSVLQAKVDDYMDKFERSEYEAQQAAQARLNVMDEDGFTVVTSAGNKGYNTDGVIRIQAIKAEEAKNIKPKKKELQDFYRFQMREAKRDSTSLCAIASTRVGNGRVFRGIRCSGNSYAIDCFHF